MNDAIDKRAWKILHDMYWGSAGWVPESKRVVSDEDFQYAKGKGVMFDPASADHAKLVMATCELVDGLDRRTVADAFLASLTTRRLDWRSALGSYSVFEHMLPHGAQGDKKRCLHCGFYLADRSLDPNLYSFYRLKWGGVVHGELAYAAFDLDQFAKAEVPKPSADDIGLFHALISSIRNAGPTVTAAQLHTHFPKEFKSNKAERDIVISILGICDILADANHPGFSDVYLPTTNRPEPNRRFTDMPYPASWWTGSIGINEARLQERFGHVL
ncbi:MAG TPA: hypothetical protein VGN46_14415 [Luteibacter sp.]|jgi:hypothetical protein|uniref:hypothetical protein n=1 Tax=Luteibacter sp. TaxID=1886636 RepID=UPI002F3F848B